YSPRRYFVPPRRSSDLWLVTEACIGFDGARLSYSVIPANAGIALHARNEKQKLPPSAGSFLLESAKRNEPGRDSGRNALAFGPPDRKSTRLNSSHVKIS